MISKSYSEAASEVLAILENTEEEAVKKIPESFIQFLVKNSSATYKPKFELDKQISELNLKPMTEALLGIIYMKYWANEEEREEFKKRIEENGKKLEQNAEEKQGIDNLFLKKEKIQIAHEDKEKLEVEVKELTVHKINFFQKIINKLKGIYRG